MTDPEAAELVEEAGPWAAGYDDDDSYFDQAGDNR